MTKIIDRIAALGQDEPFYSFEFFPPKTDSGYQNLVARLHRMAQLNPLFVNITWGAGGSTVSKSLDLATLCTSELGLTACLHLTCTNMEKKIIDEALTKAKQNGIRNILALRGDPPRGEEYWTPPESQEFMYAVDLVRYIRAEYGDYFCIGVAAYPEGYADGSNPEAQDPQLDLPYLIEKTAAGADFIMTQLFFDTDQFLGFEKMLREHESGIFKSIPIIPGLLPINTFQSFIRTAKLSHAHLPDRILEKVDAVPSTDDEQVKQVGVDILVEMIDRIYNETDHRVRGFHFYTLNLERSVALILDKSNVVKSPIRLKLVSQETKKTTEKPISIDSVLSDGVKDIKITENVAVAVPAAAVSMTAEASWDDFPNGRWGDPRSPAYGEIDGYGITLHVPPKRALELWGSPETTADISELFIQYLKGSLPVLPWSEEEGLSPETKLIEDDLIRLNKLGLWTVASQPAVNGVRSDDKIFGWGPRNGYVFQKSLIEFFVPEDIWLTLKKKLQGSDFVSYYAGNSRGDFFSNMNANDVNAVTWGVFPNREVVQPTIIEEQSFKAWSEEAFAVWKEWQRLYTRASKTSNLINTIHDSYYLVSIIHHDYVNTNALWMFLQL
ncbi:methylenetetrahydrofolate reductase-domain-containing protein [Lipomyces orientalis]|uniref:Methylenetetrahydrofolate reductase-domain-containing protein n=1 Tax=Lipomyces orientalis TaxID=1233043 RepID=A0ACC3TIK2_9ASCO